MARAALALDRRLVAVMFTDMAGYTAQLQEDERLALDRRQRYWDALERQHESSGGTIVQRLGDGSVSMFASSLSAVQAAVAIQQELAPHEIPVRIGVHLGEVVVEPERLSGDAVNVAARVESFAVPGAVLVSDAVFDQIKNRADVAVAPLGRFRFKNVGRPYEIYAVAADDVVVPEADALEGKGERMAGLPSNLPEPATHLIGRARDLTGLAALVREHRLVTITGPGGVGKTRLLVELGWTLAPEFLDGVVFVSMTEVTDRVDFLPTLADVVDVKEAEERSLADGLVALIGDRNALLLLDNLEQVVAAAPDVAWLIERCPGLRIVTTSRTPLRITAEHEYELVPLEEAPAVELFVDRVRRVRASFELTPENADAIGAVCRRLDGLPLALELAAARLRLLSPEALLERLDHALDLLSSGSRDAPERQQTLRATIDWSHSLLSAEEQRLFRRMAAFAGTCTIADVEAVCAEPGAPVLDDLESLVDKALVKVDLQDDRLRMLETIREFARERLDASGETAEIASRHAARYALVAQEIRDGIEGSSQLACVERGITEEDNLEAALETLLAAAEDGAQAACEAGMQLSGDLWMYWHIRGKNVSAREHSEAFLAADLARAPTVGRAGALMNVGLASWITGQFERAHEEWTEARQIAEELSAPRERCIAALCLAIASLSTGTAGHEWAELGVDESRALGFDWALGFSLSFAGIAYAAAGDVDLAESRLSEALEIQTRLGDHEGIGTSFSGLAHLAAARGQVDEALELYRRSLATFEAVGDRGEEARILAEIAWTCIAGGETPLARRYFFESVQAHTDVASIRGVGLSLVGLAAVEALEGRPERAVQIAAAAEMHAQQEGIVVVYSDETPGRELVERARAALLPEEAARAAENGRRLSIDEALALARSPV